MKSCVHISIKGIVQGVGFRPFVYNLAEEHQLLGYVLNNTSGVTIEVEGDASAVGTFIDRIRNEPPPQAVIFDMQSRPIEPCGYTDFSIRKSDDSEEKFVPISPEVATCKDCLAELFDPDDRRYRYPFINCTNCGPRFTIVEDIPYDRKFTTMSVFPMCAQCQKEYEDPRNRRFHAQPNACPVCGPQLSLLEADGKPVETDDAITEVCRLLQDGKIIAIKGLGGYHLACDAINKEAVAKLRARKHREYKPFALMVRDMETARDICLVNEDEEKLLTGTIRPIVLLAKKPGNSVAEGVAPNQKYFGMMLPYTPLHHTIVAESGLILVMTSGNISSEPIAYWDKEAFDRLQNITDYYLVHNREIHIRTDDPVSRIWRGKEVIYRRSRGYAPYPLLLAADFSEQILACGAELKNTFCLTRGNYAFLSHHIGDLENLETLTSFEQGIEHFKRIFNIEPSLVAYDLHPEYLSTKYALSLENIKKIGVQHHHAHIVSCMSENNIDGEVIGVAMDGTGYGTDGKIWGGEFLISTLGEFTRAAHLEYTPIPGGEKGIKEPWRLAASLLDRTYGEEMFNLDIDFVQVLDRKKWNMIKKMITKGVNSPLTSSAGRLFDAVSSLVGVRHEIYYEGQAAIELEMVAGRDEVCYPVEFRESGNNAEILTEPVIRGIVADLENGVGVDSIAARFHNTMAEIILQVCLHLKKINRLNRVVLSGGVFQNMTLLDLTCDRLSAHGFEIFTQHRVPPNDGGLALGQAIIANEKIKK